MTQTSLGTNIDKIHNLREQKRDLEAQIKAVEGEIADLESSLIDQMDSSGLDSARGKHASVTITESVKPSVEDWDAFYQFINRNKYYHLLERRPSVTGCRELFEQKGAIPGVVPFKKRSLRIVTTN